jgi:PiT family inorganic phosphate transporter
VLIIFIALVFDYVNGFHDAANSIATVVATRVLSPGVAVIWAAFFNFIAFAVFGTAVAKTIGGDMVTSPSSPERSALCLVGRCAGSHDLESHHLVSRPPDLEFARACRGVCRLAIASYVWHFGFTGVETVLKAAGWIKTLTFIVLSPLIGMALGFFFMVAVYWIFRRVSIHKIDKGFRSGSFSLPPRSRSDTEVMTLKRQWASSRSC